MQLALTIHAFYYRAKELNGNQLKELFISMLPMFGILKKLLLSVLSLPQKHTSDTHAHIYMHTNMQAFI